MTVILIIYIHIYIDLENFVNVTVYCCWRVIQMFFYCMYFCTCIMWQNWTAVSLRQFHMCPALKYIIQGNHFWPQTLRTDTVCGLDQITQVLSQARLSWPKVHCANCQCILYYTVHSIATVLLHYAIWYKNGVNIVTLAIFLML